MGQVVQFPSRGAEKPDPDEVFAEMLTRQEQREFGPTSTCPNCGAGVTAPIGVTLLRCPVCGTSVEQVQGSLFEAAGK